MIVRKISYGFGSLQPDGTSPRIRDNRISWLEPSVGGELIHSSDMGVRPLYGSYSMLGSTEFKAALAKWCNKNEMSIDFYKQYPLPAVFLVYFIQHGIGNAVLISFIFVPDDSYCLVCNTREGQGFAITWRSPVAAYSF